MELVADKVLDACGLFCPEPVMMLHQAARSLQQGQMLQVLATDPSTRRDIPRFCTFLQYHLVASQEQDGQYIYWIRKES